MIEIRNGFAECAFVQYGFLINQASHERGSAHLIDPAWNSLGVFEDTLDRVVGEESTRGVAGNAHLMLDVANRLLDPANPGDSGPRAVG